TELADGDDLDVDEGAEQMVLRQITEDSLAWPNRLMPFAPVAELHDFSTDGDAEPPRQGINQARRRGDVIYNEVGTKLLEMRPQTQCGRVEQVAAGKVSESFPAEGPFGQGANGVNGDPSEVALRGDVGIGAAADNLY